MTFFYCEGCDFYEKEWLESRKAFYYVCAKEKDKPFLSRETTPLWCSGCERGGIPLDDCLREIHRANMTRAGGDGKILKGPNYSPPDIAKVLYGA